MYGIIVLESKTTTLHIHNAPHKQRSTYTTLHIRNAYKEAPGVGYPTNKGQLLGL
jgi:hypothetical protein